MNDYKAGDRVQRSAAHQKLAFGGKVGTVLRSSGAMTKVDFDGLKWDCFDHTLELAPKPAPDVITIDRSELPEVVADGDTLECGSSTYGRANAVYFRSSAMKYLAIAEFLDARERQAAEDAAAEKLAIARRDKRRDELCQLLCSELIDLIIDLESEK